MTTDYQSFLESKRITIAPSGFEVEPSNPHLFPFQRDLVRWALKIGKAAIWADCGLGKSLMELSWAQHVVERFNAPVLILAPLSVSHQTAREGEKFGIPCRVVSSQAEVDGPGIYITNYEKLHHFDPSVFPGVCLDESSCLKSFTSVTRNALIIAFVNTPMKLCCSATPAPNDRMELGNHSEFLGVLTRTEMLSTFFVHDGGDTSKWRLKGHAQEEYWRWMCGWAVMMRKPSDLGYDDNGFVLPSLNYHHHVVKSVKNLDGFLFSVEAQTLLERRGARRDSLQERVRLCADLVLNLQPCGNQSTKKTENVELPKIRNTQQEPLTIISPVNEIPNSTRSTCESGTKTIRTTLEPTTLNRKIRSDADDGPIISTPTIRLGEKSGKRKSRTTTNEIPSLKSASIYASSESLLSNTENCLPLKTEGARSAKELKTEGINTSTWTTVTQREKLEGCSASDAILELDTSKMIRSELNEQPTTSGKPQWVVWCGLNAEQDALAKFCGDRCVSIYGSLSDSEKEKRLAQWLSGEKQILLSKVSIFGWGLNLQQCANVAFLGISDSFEEMYQGVRRCWRFGQTREVNCYVITSEAEGAVVRNIQRKEADAARMAKEMVKHMSVYNTEAVRGTVRTADTYKTKIEKGEGWEMRLGDCVEQIANVKSESVHYSIFSPPFASLYTYSASERDMGNARTHSEFFDHFSYLITELYRVLLPGRLLSFHCMNLPTSKERDGVIGITDFRGELIRMFSAAGFIYHSEVVIWKDPVTAMQRTKALGLLHKQLVKDSCMSRQGIPDYLVTMRKPGENPERVAGLLTEYVGDNGFKKPTSDIIKSPLDHYPDQEVVGSGAVRRSIDIWQRYASPVWMDIDPGKTLQKESAREQADERHICPLQLQVIERAIDLWTNPDDLVLSPFAGIGSEGYVSLQHGRRFIGFELKSSYFEQAVRNLRAAATVSQTGLFATVGGE